MLPKMRLTNFEKEVLRLVMYTSNEKTFIPMMNNLFSDRSYTYKTLKKFIPTDTGIEFEIGDSNVSLIKPYIRKMQSRMSVNMDLVIDSSFEITLRLRSTTSIKYLMQLFRLFNYVCSIPSQGGIHIHTNITTYTLTSYPFARKNVINSKDFVRFTNIYNSDWLTWMNNEIFHYGGQYNEVRCSQGKRYILNLREDFNTFEFRGINITFDRATMIKYIIVAHLMKKWLISSYRNSNDSTVAMIPDERKFLILDIMNL